MGFWEDGMLGTNPGLLERLRHSSVAFSAGPKLRREVYEASVPQKMRAAAYTPGRDAVAEVLAEGCPARLSSQRFRPRKVCPVKKAMPGTRRWGGSAPDLCKRAGLADS